LHKDDEKEASLEGTPLHITKQIVLVTRASLGIQAYKTDRSKLRLVLFSSQLLMKSSNVSQATISLNRPPAQPASQIIFRPKRAYYSLEGVLHRGLVRFGDGKYELRNGSTEQVLLSFDASSEITFVSCETSLQELYAYTTQGIMFLIFEKRQQAIVFKKYLSTSKRHAAPEGRSL
jgi:hypothetical protein